MKKTKRMITTTIVDSNNHNDDDYCLYVKKIVKLKAPKQNPQHLKKNLKFNENNDIIKRGDEVQ